MAKNTLSFFCQNCGAAYNRWQGKGVEHPVEEDLTGATTMLVLIRSPAFRDGRARTRHPAVVLSETRCKMHNQQFATDLIMAVGALL